MKLRYYSEFKSRKDKTYRIEIHTVFATYSEELTLTDSPFTVEYESDTLYKPLKMSNSVTSILTDKILSDLYTAEGQNIEVRLYNKTDDVLEWFGYMSPNLYSSDYITPLNIVEIQAIDTISVLENKKYSYINSSEVYFKSFKDVIMHILDIADPGKILSKLYFQKTNRISKDVSTSLIEDVYIHERNFFDEANEPMNSRDVLEEISKYIGMTFIQYQDAYYMIDYDFIKNDELHFFVYDRISDTCESITIPSALLNVRNIGVSESAGSISLGDVYNKVSVVANMNQITNLCPELLDDDKDIVNQNSDPNKYYISNRDIDGKNHTLLNSFFKSKENWGYLIPSFSFIDIPAEGVEVSIDNVNDIYSGVVWQKYSDYTTEDGEPSSLSWKTCVSFLQAYNMIGASRKTLLTLKNGEYSLFKGGYFIINIAYKMSGSFLPNDIIKTSDEAYSNTKYGAGFDNTMVPCKLYIDDYYYDGEVWRNRKYYTDRVARGYYKSTNNLTYQGAIWYRYKDGFGDWRFVTKGEYDSTSGEKASGGYDDRNKVYAYRENGENIFVEKWYHDECVLKDGFYLVHINKENDKVFDDEKRLTNTVSYRFNLYDSTDGVAIKLPDDKILCGKIRFELSTPNHLGKYPMYRTDGGCHPCTAFHISDFTFKYTNNKVTYDIFNNAVDDSDVVYSNVINDNNVTEMDDIELLINSNAKNISSYSNCATKSGDKFDYLKAVYSPLHDKNVLPEQILIDKLYTHYKAPKFRYSNNLNRGFSILSRIYENSLKREMIVDQMNIDYANESCNVSLIEA
ncbi:hypothetical protein [Candidatus Bacteroides intestinigallinarum]|uniref:hypothetical protein n=1 Tax=Candidatus Bacteroides intestinigallinarum TaxID=2838470 RepID=UPI0021658DE5|nr:hypothetical protein [Candidatus Bacteroides intestinigallinarum]MCS3203004.1 hypothetical protein [Candidatus Bacteroides intestinigallinarum]